eukprot:TRINITY_DN2815_c4_g1_i4.p1 TRINITY_DN2815_c4_g1~~TRINITY_DN2815_c4_g1_i4.p1  ORF type:complete len:183 (-),score=35.25 TRINITY_DN2815_c4_g1_i4:24-572(-)
MDLKVLVEQFVAPDNAAEEQNDGLNKLLIVIHQKQVTLQELVNNLGDYLTNSDEILRSRGTELLALVLERLPTLRIEQAQAGLLIQFFGSRLSDFSSLPNVIKGLRALIVTHHRPADPLVTTDEVVRIVQLIFEDVPMRALPVAVRGAILKMLRFIVESYPAATKIICIRNSRSFRGNRHFY